MYSLTNLAQLECPDECISHDTLKTKTYNDMLMVFEHKILELARQKEKKGNIDHHENAPTNVVTQLELSKVQAKLLNLTHKWESTAVKINSMTTTLIRHDGMKKVTLGKLMVISHLPPNGIKTPHDGDEWSSVLDPLCDPRMLTFIIPKLDQVKKNKGISSKQTEVVGGYRHKRYERCFIGTLAMSFLVVKVHDPKYELDFLQKQSQEVPQSQEANTGEREEEGFSNDRDDENCDESNLLWRHHKVFQNGYHATYSAIKNAFENAEVPLWTKVTHLR